MKRLILLRHAEAVPKNAARDFDRALSSAGREEAREMAAPLAGLQPRPTVALVSPSRRTRETWTSAGASLGDIAVRFEQAIYEASTSGLLGIISELGDDVDAAILVGHNPAFEEVANRLAAPSLTLERTDLSAGMPTGSAAIIDIEGESWRDVADRGGRLVAFLRSGAV